MKLNLVLLSFVLMVAIFPNARGQSIGPSVINAAGGSGTAGGNTFEWSIGELMVSTFTSSSLVVTQGVLQPNMSTTGIPSGLLTHKLDVFPNPSSAIVNINFDAPGSGSLSYKLVDVLGRTLQENAAVVKAGNNNYQLDIRTLACATYMLHVTYKVKDAQDESTVYKIQKLN